MVLSDGGVGFGGGGGGGFSILGTEPLTCPITIPPPTLGIGVPDTFLLMLKLFFSAV